MINTIKTTGIEILKCYIPEGEWNLRNIFYKCFSFLFAAYMLSNVIFFLLNNYSDAKYSLVQMPMVCLLYFLLRIVEIVIRGTFRLFETVKNDR